jgi:hypothetical protein
LKTQVNLFFHPNQKNLHFADFLILSDLGRISFADPQSSALKIKIFNSLGISFADPQSSALKIIQTKKRSSKLGVFSY